MTSSLCRNLDRRARPTRDTQSTIAVATSSIVGVRRSRAGITTWWTASFEKAARTESKPIRDSKMRQRRSGDVGMDRSRLPMTRQEVPLCSTSNAAAGSDLGEQDSAWRAPGTHARIGPAHHGLEWHRGAMRRNDEFDRVVSKAWLSVARVEAVATCVSGDLLVDEGELVDHEPDRIEWVHRWHPERLGDSIDSAVHRSPGVEHRLEPVT